VQEAVSILYHLNWKPDARLLWIRERKEQLRLLLKNRPPRLNLRQRKRKKMRVLKWNLLPKNLRKRKSPSLRQKQKLLLIWKENKRRKKRKQKKLSRLEKMTEQIE
jgi:hypothetical protein